MDGVSIADRITEMGGMSVGRLVAEGPHRAHLLEKWGIDYCCGGRRTLDEVCHERALTTAKIVRELLQVDAIMQEVVPTTDWNRASLCELCDHIERTHHDYLRKSLPRIDNLMEKVVAAHGSADERLMTLQSLFAQFRDELDMHTQKEEQILFPWVRILEVTAKDGTTVADAAVPIETLLAEHDEAGGALRRMRTLTDDFVPPETACNLYRALMKALAELEADMHQHVHKENNILFPRVLDAQNSRDER